MTVTYDYDSSGSPRCARPPLNRAATPGRRRGAPRPASRTRPLAALAVLLALAAPGRPASAVPQPVGEVRERGRDGVTFVVELGELRTREVELGGRRFTAVSAAGFGLTSDPGLPMLPFRTFTIALPPGTEPAPRVRVLESETLELLPAPSMDPEMHIAEDGSGVPGFRFALDETFYGSSRTYPELPFESAPVSGLRQQRVFDLTVYPVRYDAGRGQLVVARRLEVRVDFHPTAGLLEGGGPARLGAPPHERGFESIYRGTVLNYESGRAWRQGPVLRKGAPAGSSRLANREWKITVRETGMTRVRFADLPGFETGIPVAQLALFEKRYVDAPGVENFVAEPVAIEVLDADQNGVFDGDDSFVFYGRNLRSRVGPEPYLNRYSNDNVYWLTWSASGGLRPVPEDGWLDLAAPAMPAAFPDTVHLEKDIYNFDYAPHPSVSPAYTTHERVNPWYMVRHFPRVLGTYPRCTGDEYCIFEPGSFNLCRCAALEFPFEIWDFDPGQPIAVRTLMVSSKDGFDHLASFALIDGNQETTEIVNRWSFSGHLAMGLYESDPLPASALTEGGNTFHYRGERSPDGSPGQILSDGSGAHFDWFEVLYQHRYRAHNDVVICNTGETTGDVQLEVGGFTGSDILVFDITEPQAIARLDGTQISAEGGGRYQVRFQDTVSTRHTYAVLRPGAGRAPLAMVEDAPSSLAAPAVEPDIIIVTHDDFTGDLERLKSHREAQGYTVEVARITDVYDEFDGGLRRAFAIRNYLRHAFREWSRPPLYLLLVGDANEDYKDLDPRGANLVPSQMMFGPVRGDIDLEIISSDTWYVAGLAPGDPEFDLHFDMYVGRLPAQTREECRELVDKIIRYEDFQPGDDWRAQTLTISDDAWSSTISFNDVYRYRPSEVIFQALSDSLNDMVNREMGDLIRTRAWKLSTYSDDLPEQGRTEGTVKAHVDTTGSPILYRLISEGNLMMNYQGHANRHLLAHERIFSSEFDRHQERFDNTGRPTLWFLFACHPNELDEVTERVADQVGGRERALGELLLARPGAGLIGCLASTGFEWLPGGLFNGPPYQYDLNTPIWQAFFQTPPVEDPQGGAMAPRWLLGEVVNHAKQLYNLQDSFKGPMFSYMLLGDPALHIDAVPPHFAVTADDTARTDGARIEVYTADTDTVAVEAEIRDEVRIAAVEVLEVSQGDGSTRTIDPSLVRIDSLGPPPVTARHLRVSFAALLRPDSYDIVLRARDANGRQIEQSLEVRADVAIEADDVPLHEGDFIRGDALVTALIHSPVPIVEGDVELAVIETGGAPQPLAEQTKSRLDAIGKEWSVAGLLDLEGGQHELLIQLDKETMTGLRQRFAFQVTGAGELALQQVATYPNPFSERTTFNYQLTNWADEVRIRVYAISGRLVNELQGSTNAGYSQILWNGRDRDGDPVANGVYIYTIRARGAGHDDTFTGKLIRSRR